VVPHCRESNRSFFFSPLGYICPNNTGFQMGVFAEWRNDYCGNYMYINDSYGSCKAVYLGSIPGRASSVPPLRDRSKARMVKLVDTRDLKSPVV
jgi:hypothetical protein